MVKSEKQFNNGWTFLGKLKEKNPNLKVVLSNARSTFLYIPLGDKFSKDILL